MTTPSADYVRPPRCPHGCRGGMRWAEDQWYCPSCGSEWHGHSGYGKHGSWERVAERITGGKTVYWRRQMADGHWLTVSRHPEVWTWKLRRYEPREVLDEGRAKTVQQGMAAALDAWYLSEVVAAHIDRSGRESSDA